MTAVTILRSPQKTPAPRKSENTEPVILPIGIKHVQRTSEETIRQPYNPYPATRLAAKLKDQSLKFKQSELLKAQGIIEHGNIDDWHFEPVSGFGFSSQIGKFERAWSGGQTLSLHCVYTGASDNPWYYFASINRNGARDFKKIAEGSIAEQMYNTLKLYHPDTVSISA